MKTLLKKTFLYRLYRERQIKKDRDEEIRLNREIRFPLIQKYIPKNGIGAELGVLRGDFSPILLEASQAKELHLIDPWYFLEPVWTWAGGQDSTIEAVREILKNMKTEIAENRVFVHIQDDILVLKQFEDSSLDWAYIDSSHEYHHTVKELELLKVKVKSTGIICGDDWQPDPAHRHHGVYKAVNEFMEKENYELIYGNAENKQWFIRKKSN